MNKGRIFLIFTVLVLLVAAYYFIFQYERPQEYKAPRVTELSTIVTVACEGNITCFVNALADCELASFTIPDPSNESNSFKGNIMGEVFDKCELMIQDPLSGASMSCFMNRGSLNEIASLDGLSTACSGELLELLI